MRVLFPDFRGAKSGRGHFLSALAWESDKHGVDALIYDESIGSIPDHDISLHSIRMWCETNKPRILRLDGVYHDNQKDYTTGNRGLRDNANMADGVVCQSEFSKKMVMEFLGVREDKIQVIFNGAMEYDLGGERDGNNYFLAVSKWRPHKRLTDIIESFLLADLPETYLYVLGDTAKSECNLTRYENNPKIVFKGTIKNRSQLFNYYHYAIASIHLCTFDACPNSVVEAIVAGCPVITNNTGGTHEIVRPSGGIVLDIDPVYNYKPLDLYNPTPIDRRLVADAMVKVCENRPKIIRDHVSISNIAKQYITYLKRFV
jgi:glycosyltransferase involved in cell wall biosynthesis